MHAQYIELALLHDSVCQRGSKSVWLCHDMFSLLCCVVVFVQGDEFVSTKCACTVRQVCSTV